MCQWLLSLCLHHAWLCLREPRIHVGGANPRARIQAGEVCIIESHQRNYSPTVYTCSVHTLSCNCPPQWYLCTTHTQIYTYIKYIKICVYKYSKERSLNDLGVTPTEGKGMVQIIIMSHPNVRFRHLWCESQASFLHNHCHLYSP